MYNNFTLSNVLSHSTTPLQLLLFPAVNVTGHIASYTPILSTLHLNKLLYIASIAHG